MKRDGAHPACAVVFGGAGFIGTHLVQRLRQQGVEKVVSVDIAEPEKPVSGVDYIFADVRSQIPLDMVDQAPSIYDLSAVHRTPGHPDRDYYETNVAGALNIAEFARKTGATSIVFTSSIAVYGPSEELKSEDSVPRPISAYGWSKLLAENVYRQWSEGARAQLVIVRPAVVFGKGENGNFTRLAGALEKRMFVYPGRTDTVKSCGYVGELLRSMEFVLGLGEQYALYNFCYPERSTISEICKALEEVAGLPRPVGAIPMGLLNLAAMPFEAASSLGLRNPINRERIAKLVTSTNIKPGYLSTHSYHFETDLRAGLALWEKDAGGFR
ncbi:NAD-dependent epimerase/dehydratase family protein [Oceanicaulis sp. UBA2681]|uniref:NAD-dependent epimerase/dehydratase family protein n=1 Tax=Oceanicaulis sp. UBA2681 TaxID=1947007 RepID=UPI00257E53D9|nr:NAD(P)-dependent oxidoreductase [Oceanicaulis sp. UBA2681]|tara:strand:- start:8405 stop:9385 length:981 start_codon:yes stop_codon:yes gene_type:complete